MRVMEADERVRTPLVGAMEPAEAQERIKAISLACVDLYPVDMGEPELQITLAALSQNHMFQRLYNYARRAELTHALGQVEAQIARSF
ncbi:hypothetical protein K2Z83_13445 [Oscillochloris sp. ZM17-4]|uniref:hypothetical protein n=1 Tax=Oscillochloris sp. ZM17-4 TaxID=2866714 RepID=UPI001C73A7F7|nr:hypothetical protein [Oscillochloris sp. ZM17-4]MBX0328681.1 hypothetical protein [Oscillochloris sp. ZM17-4]